MRRSGTYCCVLLIKSIRCKDTARAGCLAVSAALPFEVGWQERRGGVQVAEAVLQLMLPQDIENCSKPPAEWWQTRVPMHRVIEQVPRPLRFCSLLSCLCDCTQPASLSHTDSMSSPISLPASQPDSNADVRSIKCQHAAFLLITPQHSQLCYRSKHALGYSFSGFSRGVLEVQAQALSDAGGGQEGMLVEGDAQTAHVQQRLQELIEMGVVEAVDGDEFVVNQSDTLHAVRPLHHLLAAATQVLAP